MVKMDENRQNIKYLIRKNGRIISIRGNRDRVFFPDEWMRFFDCLKKSQKFTFTFLLNTGARINEARHVKAGDVDVANKRIILRVTKVKARGGEKNPRPRTIPISSQFSRIIKREMESKSNEEYFRILSTPAANIGMKKALQKACINDWYMFSIHNIRKTFETWLMALGIDGLKITAHLGHSMSIAAQNYISTDVFTWKEKDKIRMIIGDLYQR